MARGDNRHRVVFQNPAPATANGDGGYTQAWADLPPGPWMVSIEPATAAVLERVAAGTTISSASHLVRGDFHPGVTTQTRMLFQSQVFAIAGVVNVDMRGITMICGAVQLVP